MTAVLIKGGNLDTETDMCTGEHRVNMKAEIGMVHLQAKGCQKWQRTTGG